jgi:hypothetical protein
MVKNLFEPVKTHNIAHGNFVTKVKSCFLVMSILESECTTIIYQWKAQHLFYPSGVAACMETSIQNLKYLCC